MRNIISLILGMIFAVLVQHQCYAGPTLSDYDFYTEKYPPYNFRAPDGQLTGIAVDLLKKTMLKIDPNKPLNYVNALAWYESYQTVRSKENTMLFSAVRNDSRENLFKWAGPIDAMSGVLLAKKSSHIGTIKEIDNIKKFKVGSITEDSDTQILLDLGLKKASLNLADNGSELLYMLDNGQVDMIAYSLTVLKWLIKNNKADFDDYVILYHLQEKNLYYAFNIKTDDALIKTFQEAFDSLKVKKNGLKSDAELIRDKYLK